MARAESVCSGWFSWRMMSGADESIRKSGTMRRGWQAAAESALFLDRMTTLGMRRR